MNSPSPRLAEIQHWMLAEITAPHEIRQDATAERILPGRLQTAAERLAVYRHAYFARLLDVLREQFPCTRWAVGDELFDEFAVGYLERHPPHSYTLARLADRLVKYLDESRPADWGQFIVELARLEQAIDRVFDAAGPEHLPPLALPPASSGNLRLTFVPGFELLAFHYPVSAYYTAWKANESPGWPAEEPQFIALHRRDYIVRRTELTEIQFRLIAALGEGTALDGALEAAFAGAPPGELPSAAEIGEWFQAWATRGFFAAAQ